MRKLALRNASHRVVLSHIGAFSLRQIKALCNIVFYEVVAGWGCAGTVCTNHGPRERCTRSARIACSILAKQ